jgi:hypothetical protein
MTFIEMFNSLVFTEPDNFRYLLVKLENDGLKNWPSLNEDLKKIFVERAKFEWRAFFGALIDSL